MKRIFYRVVMAFIVASFAMPLSQLQAWNFENKTVSILEEVYEEANEDIGKEVQNTDLDVVTSKYSQCDGISDNGKFPITRVLCSIKVNMKDYIQYAVYFGLALATIFLIRNGFKIVTSSDREKQLGVFKKNLWYIVIGVVFLTGFYYIIDIFVSVVNLIAE